MLLSHANSDRTRTHKTGSGLATTAQGTARRQRRDGARVSEPLVVTEREESAAEVGRTARGRPRARSAVSNSVAR